MTVRIRNDASVRVVTENPQPTSTRRYSFCFILFGTAALVAAIWQGVLSSQDDSCNAWHKKWSQATEALESSRVIFQRYKNEFKERAVLNCKSALVNKEAYGLSKDVHDFCYTYGKIPDEWSEDTNLCDKSWIYFQKYAGMPLSCYAKNAMDADIAFQKSESHYRKVLAEKPSPLC